MLLTGLATAIHGWNIYPVIGRDVCPAIRCIDCAGSRNAEALRNARY